MADDPLTRAFASTRTVLEGVKGDHLGEATPCRSWTVRDLINHMIAAPRVGASALTTGEMNPADDDFAAGDFVAAYDESIRQTLAAFAVPGAADRMVKLPFAEVPGAFLRIMVTTDQFTHGWDLARATGQSTDLDPQLAEQLLAEVMIPGEFRGEDGSAPFGPVREAPNGAGHADRLAAHLGREV
ncbi:MAG: TIGR03086 family metal-binding protein [Acidimicrobiales bacterium]